MDSLCVSLCSHCRTDRISLRNCHLVHKFTLMDYYSLIIDLLRYLINIHWPVSFPFIRGMAQKDGLSHGHITRRHYNPGPATGTHAGFAFYQERSKHPSETEPAPASEIPKR